MVVNIKATSKHKKETEDEVIFVCLLSETLSKKTPESVFNYLKMELEFQESRNRLN